MVQVDTLLDHDVWEREHGQIIEIPGLDGVRHVQLQMLL